VLALALVCGLALAAVVLSLFALVRARSLPETAVAPLVLERHEAESELAALRQSLSELAARIVDLESREAAVPALPKPGFNISKRSQALRMHRSGQTAEQIALELGASVQEIDLLLKVHHIVLSSL
jgi:hypothetical protein